MDIVGFSINDSSHPSIVVVDLDHPDSERAVEEILGSGGPYGGFRDSRLSEPVKGAELVLRAGS